MHSFLEHLRFLDASSNLDLALVATYNPLLVVLSIIVACMAAYGALRIVGSINAAGTFATKTLWLATGAVTMGIGVWAMHFVAMLAFILPVAVSYNIVITLVSMLPSIFAAGVMLHVISRDQIGIRQLLLGGTLMGAGIGVMHYTGMAAMQLQAVMLYDPVLFIVSVVVAVVLASIALYTKFLANRHLHAFAQWTQVGAALIMGFAVAGMHYTGMAAAYFFPGHGAHGVTAAADPVWLSTWVTLITLGLTGITILVTILDQRLESSRRRGQKLETLVAGRTQELQAAYNQLQIELEQRRQAQEALIETEDRLQHLLQRSSAILYSTKAEEGFPITFVSSSVESVLGYTVQEFYAPNFFWSHIHPADAAPTAARLKQAMEEGRMSMEYRLLMRDGNYRWFRDEVVAVYDQQKEPIELVGSAVDITARKAMEEELASARDQALEGSRLKSEFLATVSHEIRTPLNGITGMADLMLNTALTQEQTEYLRTICYSADSLLTIINDVLDLSMVEAGKLALVKRVFNPMLVVHDAARILSLRAQEQNLTMHVEIAPDLPEFVRGDDTRLRQILLNLVGNAVKFTEKGGVVIRAARADNGTTPSDDPSNQTCAQEIFVARFTISDTGIGLDEAARSRLFQPFSQVDSSFARKHGGAGLGLVICKRLVDLMGGEIGVESKPGVGSDFWFTVPLERADEGEVEDVLAAQATEPWLAPVAEIAPHEVKNDEQLHASAQDNGEAHQDDKTQKSSRVISATPEILLVEDNLVNQMVAIAHLNRLGFTVHTVNNGREAVNAVQSRSYDLILMDCQMPEMDGFEATRAIRAIESQSGRSMPIIAMTANAMRGDRDACLAAGMDDYLSKPFRPEQLRDIIHLWLKKTSII